MPAINLFQANNLPSEYTNYTIHDIKLGAAYGDVDGPEVSGFFTLDLSLDCLARINYAHVEIGPKHHDIKLPGCMSYVAQNLGEHLGVSLACADYSDPTLMQRINQLGADRRKDFLDASTAQSNLKRSLGVNDTRIACMGLLLAQLIADEKMTATGAAATLEQNFSLDTAEASRIVESATAYQARQQLLGRAKE